MNAFPLVYYLGRKPGQGTELVLALLVLVFLLPLLVATLDDLQLGFSEKDLEKGGKLYPKFSVLDYFAAFLIKNDKHTVSWATYVLSY